MDGSTCTQPGQPGVWVFDTQTSSVVYSRWNSSSLMTLYTRMPHQVVAWMTPS